MTPSTSDMSFGGCGGGDHVAEVAGDVSDNNGGLDLSADVGAGLRRSSACDALVFSVDTDHEEFRVFMH